MAYAWRMALASLGLRHVFSATLAGIAADRAVLAELRIRPVASRLPFHGAEKRPSAVSWRCRRRPRRDLDDSRNRKGRRARVSVVSNPRGRRRGPLRDVLGSARGAPLKGRPDDRAVAGGALPSHDTAIWTPLRIAYPSAPHERSENYLNLIARAKRGLSPPQCRRISIGSGPGWRPITRRERGNWYRGSVAARVRHRSGQHAPAAARRGGGRPAPDLERERGAPADRQDDVPRGPN